MAPESLANQKVSRFRCARSQLRLNVSGISDGCIQANNTGVVFHP